MNSKIFVRMTPVMIVLTIAVAASVRTSTASELTSTTVKSVANSVSQTVNALFSGTLTDGPEEKIKDAEDVLVELNKYRLAKAKDPETARMAPSLKELYDEAERDYLARTAKDELIQDADVREEAILDALDASLRAKIRELNQVIYDRDHPFEKLKRERREAQRKLRFGFHP